MPEVGSGPKTARDIPDRGVIQVAAETIEALGAELDAEQQALVDEATLH